MNFTDELVRLAKLRDDGRLTEQEFVAAKKQLLFQGGVSAQNGASDIDPSNDTLASERTFWSSRWSANNHFFRDSIVLASDGIMFRRGSLFGTNEELINYHAVASIRIKNGLLFASITVETAGGSQPIFVDGLGKTEAKEIKEAIRSFQNLL